MDNYKNSVVLIKEQFLYKNSNLAIYLQYNSWDEPNPFKNFQWRYYKDLCLDILPSAWNSLIFQQL